MELPYIVAVFLKTLVDVVSKPVLRIGTMNGIPFADIIFDDEPRQTIDERIAKIDAARSNLADALVAIDELKAAASANKADLEVALEQLGRTQAEHNAARKELELVRQVANSDVETFQRLAGVPSKSQIAKERALGFVFGVIASVFASGIWWGVTKLWPYLKT
ncbi:hypothetical protein [Polaromonas sp.]|uniref:hypothetical protein n=1 Tax=Polaromonas sp. TaxID=1869339 RepID=UPI0032640BCD